MRDRIIGFATEYPKFVFVIVTATVLFTGFQITKATVDTDPQNMLPADQAERLFHNASRKTFQLHDMLVVGVVNEKDAEGVFNPRSLNIVHQLGNKIANLRGVIKRDLMALTTVDKVTPEGEGAVRFDWLLKDPPKTRQQARAIREAAMRLPTLKDTVVSGNGKAVAIYVPIENKNESHRISQEISQLFKGFNGDERFFIAGLPVAEDTFGVEMFKQMAISAPLAALVIFFIMWLFFRNIPLIVSPMLVAMSTVIVTMGALIGLGFPVHIMSSMIPIFLMPIAVVNSVHILSSFSDQCRVGADAKPLIHAVMKKLFTPMLYTSLTTIAGFGSLSLAPIPPVKVFGIAVAFGVLISFVMTIVFIPAYVVSLSKKQIHKMVQRHESGDRGLLSRVLPKIGRQSVARAHLIIFLMLAIGGISAYGITRIQINDNPVRWFKPSHEIRIADRVLNKHFAGTYPAYLVLTQESDTAEKRLQRSLKTILQSTQKNGTDLTARWEALNKKATEEDLGGRLTKLIELVDEEREEASEDEDRAWDKIAGVLEKAQMESKFFQGPEALAFLAKLQEELGSSKVIGKSSSIVDIVKTLNRDLHDGQSKHFSLPRSSAAVAQALLTFQSSHNPHMLWHFVTPDFRSANLWVQLKSGDNQHMIAVTEQIKRYLERHPPPPGVSVKWAGMTYLNVIWQQEMVSGMLNSLLGSFAIVLVMMIILFRSVIFGVLSMIPLSLTITFIYGLIGIVGKDYDMPIAVLSAMTLGLSVDFAIHFLQRARKIYSQSKSWRRTLELMFGEPGRAISRNAIVIAIGFTPLLAAPLVPYNTVGFFMAAIMAISSIVTLILLPAVMHVFAKRLPVSKQDTKDVLLVEKEEVI